MNDITKISEKMLRKVIKEKLERKKKRERSKDPAKRLFEWGNALKIDTFLDERLVAKIIAKKLHEASPGAGESKEDLPIPDSSVTGSSWLSGYKIEEPETEEDPPQEDPPQEVINDVIPPKIYKDIDDARKQLTIGGPEPDSLHLLDQLKGNPTPELLHGKGIVPGDRVNRLFTNEEVEKLKKDALDNNIPDTVFFVAIDGGDVTTSSAGVTYKKEKLTIPKSEYITITFKDKIIDDFSNIHGKMPHSNTAVNMINFIKFLAVIGTDDTSHTNVIGSNSNFERLYRSISLDDKDPCDSITGYLNSLARHEKLMLVNMLSMIIYRSRGTVRTNINNGYAFDNNSSNTFNTRINGLSNRDFKSDRNVIHTIMAEEQTSLDMLRVFAFRKEFNNDQDNMALFDKYIENLDEHIDQVSSESDDHAQLLNCLENIKRILLAAAPTDSQEQQ